MRWTLDQILSLISSGGMVNLDAAREFYLLVAAVVLVAALLAFGIAALLHLTLESFEAGFDGGCPAVQLVVLGFEVAQQFRIDGRRRRRRRWLGSSAVLRGPVRSNCLRLAFGGLLNVVLSAIACLPTGTA